MITEQLIKAVVRAAQDACRDMLGIRIRSDRPVERFINADTGVCSEICALISFVGEASGVLMLKCSKKIAAEFATRMLGLTIEPESEELRDAIGELLNIILGSAKSYYSSDNAFKISIPTTVVGRDFSLYVQANAGETVYYIPLRSGNARFGIELYID